MGFDDVRRTVEATLGNLTPARAQELAKQWLEPGAAKEQVAKTAADILEWSHRSRERFRQVVRREIEEQMRSMGVATRSDVDTVKKRVRELERRAGMTASGRKRTATRRTAAKRTGTKSAAATSAAKRSAAKA